MWKLNLCCVSVSWSCLLAFWTRISISTQKAQSCPCGLERFTIKFLAIRIHGSKTTKLLALKIHNSECLLSTPFSNIMSITHFQYCQHFLVTLCSALLLERHALSKVIMETNENQALPSSHLLKLLELIEHC